MPELAIKRLAGTDIFCFFPVIFFGDVPVILFSAKKISRPRYFSFVWAKKLVKTAKIDVQKNYAMSIFEICKLSKAYSSVSLTAKVEYCFFAKLTLEIIVLYRKIEKYHLCLRSNFWHFVVRKLT